MKAIAVATIIAGFLAGPAYAACTYPTAPDRIPDGNTATMDDMLAAKKLVDEYNTDMTAYLDCIKLEHGALMAQNADLTDDQKKELEARQVQKHNAAIDELEGVAGRFNEQIRVFKAKNK